MTKKKIANKRKKYTLAFTLIELLAVIIILGILMIIAVPAVTKYINNSRKSSYISSAKSIISGTTTLANSESLNMNDKDTTYYIPAKYIKTEKDLKTPYGEFTEAYVGVVTDGKSYQYYWVSNDTSKQGIKIITEKDKLEIDQIEENLLDSDIRTTVETTGIEDRNKILILNLDGTWQEERIATHNLNEDGEIEPTDTLLAIFMPGIDFNSKAKKIANHENADYSTVDTNVIYIKRSKDEPDANNKQEKNIVSAQESEVPIYAWFDSGTLYWWSEDYKPNLNSDANYMFYNLRGLKEIELDKMKTNNTTGMVQMFFNCISLETIDVSKFDTSKVTNMNGMFFVSYAWNASAVISNTKEIVGLENFDTSNVENMMQMFNGQVRIKKLDLRSFNTSKVNTMYAMFNNCLSLEEVNLSSFDTSNVVDMAAMFQHNSSLKKIDLSSFDTSSVTDISYMFGCGGSSELCKLTEIKGIEKLNTSNITNMKMLFIHQTSLRTLDLSGWDTRNVQDTQNMFGGTNLTTIYVSNSFDLSNVTSSNNMFNKELFSIGVSSSYVLTGGAGTTYSSSHTNKEYARIDDPANGKPGYFTLKTS